MNAFDCGIEALDAMNDPELTEAYRTYVQRIEGLLSEEELDTYRSYLQRGQSTSGPNPEELAVAEKVAADPQIGSLYQAYLARLGSRQAMSNQATQASVPPTEARH